MNNKTPRIIAFLSGKGGSGKTTVAIAISKLLSDTGYSNLLIDFDLGTNGGAYFFKGKFTRLTKGIWEKLENTNIASSTQASELPIAISDNFFFVASRADFNLKGPSYDSVSYERDRLKQEILKPLINWAADKNLSYVLIDCQSGYTISSAAAAEVADTAIIVTEADSISSDASDNLLIQLGNSLPSERRYLVNKIDVRDAETYSNMRNVFQSLNRLPPLPFDFAVRNAFGARQIPVDIKSPSPLLFALLETTKYIFTEIFEKLESYRKEHIDILFEEYDNKFQDLQKKKQKAEQELIDIKTKYLRRRNRFYQIGIITVILFLVATGIIFGFRLLGDLTGEIADILMFEAIAMGSLAGIFLLFLTRKQYVTKLKDEIKESELSREIESLNKDLDIYRSLIWAKSREYLIDVEIAGGAKKIRESEITSDKMRS